MSRVTKFAAVMVAACGAGIPAVSSFAALVMDANAPTTNLVVSQPGRSGNNHYDVKANFDTNKVNYYGEAFVPTSTFTPTTVTFQNHFNNGPEVKDKFNGNATIANGTYGATVGIYSYTDVTNFSTYQLVASGTGSTNVHAGDDNNGYLHVDVTGGPVTAGGNYAVLFNFVNQDSGQGVLGRLFRNDGDVTPTGASTGSALYFQYDTGANAVDGSITPQSGQDATFWIQGVPEPTSFGLLGVGGMIFAARRRRSC